MNRMSNPAPSRELVEGWLTQERLARYVAVAGNDTAAVELYEWDITASGAFYEVLGMVEVLLRNAMHTQLVHWQLRRGRSCAWFDDPTTGPNKTTHVPPFRAWWDARRLLLASRLAGRTVHC